MVKYPPVLVRWNDCFVGSEVWTEDGSPPDDPVVINTVGWIIPNHLDGYVVVTDSWFDRDETLFYGGMTYIPARMVEEIVQL